MELKYSQAIKAGVIGGIIIIALVLLRLVMDIIGEKVLTSGTISAIFAFVDCCVWIPILIVMVATGALAVRYSRAGLMDLNDSLIVGAVAGAVAGIMAAIIMVIVIFVSPFIFPDTYNSITGVGIAGSTSLASGMLASCCCGPFMIILDAALGAIGGAIYYMLKK
ncbi:MAG TPA: hypothetical protein VK436_08680 [Methanocella sp.]|nr:hypothetical protein [Methanocella sp.]